LYDIYAYKAAAKGRAAGKENQTKKYDFQTLLVRKALGVVPVIRLK
jgi:hypothetical protein